MTTVSLEVFTNRPAVMKRFRDIDRQKRKRRMRVMSTPTTVKFQIAVSSTDENGQAIEKLFLVDMTITSENGEVLGIELVPATNQVSNDNEHEVEAEATDPEIVASSVGMPPQDPPKAQVVISLAA
jgi:hypothetical protein